MGLSYTVFKCCPTCQGRASMTLRGNVSNVDLDDLKELSLRYKPSELLDLYNEIIADGDPFFCSQCGWDHRFFLDGDRRLAVATMLFGDAPRDED